MPGLVRKHIASRKEVILQGHPLRDEHISFLRDGASVHDFLTDPGRRPPRAFLRKAERFPGALFANLIPPLHVSFVDVKNNPS